MSFFPAASSTRLQEHLQHPQLPGARRHPQRLGAMRRQRRPQPRAGRHIRDAAARGIARARLAGQEPQDPREVAHLVAEVEEPEFDGSVFR